MDTTSSKLDSETEYLMHNLKAIQRCLREIFFDQSSYLLAELDKLWHLCESVLLTSFKNIAVNDDATLLDLHF